VLLPRFNATQAFELAKELAALGMRSAFGSESDFSGMTRTPDLWLSDVVHKAYVEVNEEGTEAAAATRVEAYSKGRPRNFSADHPFIFLVRENRTGSVLFLGRIVDPSRRCFVGVLLRFPRRHPLKSTDPKVPIGTI